MAEREKVTELEAMVATLKKQNTRLKNELKFTAETEKRTSGDYIATLQKDLESLQSRNEQISLALMQAESQLKNNEISQAKVESASSAKMAAHSAALVERLSSAQRERERVLASQLRQVMDEKQQLLERLGEDGQEMSSDQCDDSTEKLTSETSNLLELANALKTTKGVFELQQGGDKLVKALKKVQEEKAKGIQSKLDMLREESQEALCKKEMADEQIEKLKRKLEMLKTEYKLVDKTRIKALQSQLQTALAERDSWQKKADKFEDTCETLRVLSSLQKSMSKEDDICRQYDEELVRYRHDVDSLTKQTNQIVLERNQVVLERNELIHERDQLVLQSQQEYERAERLKRLVVVLRKKVGAINSSDRFEPAPSSPVYDI